MGYLSVEHPWTYQKFRKIPQAAFELFAGAPDAAVPEGVVDEPDPNSD